MKTAQILRFTSTSTKGSTGGPLCQVSFHTQPVFDATGTSSPRVLTVTVPVSEAESLISQVQSRGYIMFPDFEGPGTLRTFYWPFVCIDVKPVE